jgi:hypothetical protein
MRSFAGKLIEQTSLTGMEAFQTAASALTMESFLQSGEKLGIFK